MVIATNLVLLMVPPNVDFLLLQMASGIQDYFDKALPQLLLYDEELDDYKVSPAAPAAHMDKLTPCSISATTAQLTHGVSHLLAAAIIGVLRVGYAYYYVATLSLQNKCHE